MARRLLGDYHVTGLFWYRFHRWAMGNMPSWSYGIIITIFTTFFFCTIFNIRRAIASNLVPVLGPCGFFVRQRRIYRTFWDFAWCLSERYERLTTSRSFDVDASGLEHWREACASGEGLVMVTAHLGAYEIGSMVPAEKDGRRVHLVREPEVDPRAQEFIRESVATVESARYTMHFQNDDPLQGVAFLEALRRGEIVAMQGDRPRAGARVIRGTLFGRPFTFPAGPFALARTAGAPILPVFAIRRGRRQYHVVFSPPVRVARSADRARDLAAAAACIGSEIEKAIRLAPNQWFCFRELWPDTAAASR
ncbi:MAG TPA: lysophospholipid acyltransferase family protein [Candidatus Polarisedimenticolaceae bacterium]|nr:lysophospholipid acyltransferase family protein [Candidatus Polarisedimenticolaceae bacterium]